MIKNPPRPLRLASAKKLLGTINREFGSLPFCRRYLDRVGEQNYLLGVSHSLLFLLRVRISASHEGLRGQYEKTDTLFEFPCGYCVYDRLDSYGISSEKGSYRLILPWRTSKDA